MSANRQTATHPPTIIESHDVSGIPTAYRAQLGEAGLLELAPISCWTVTGSNQQNAYSTHGIFRYFGKYPPPIGHRLIHEYSNPGELVLDPMCGSGTTGVETVLSERRGVQFDINPLSVSLATAKTTHVPSEVSQKTLERVLSASQPASFEEYPLRPEGLRNPAHWFLPETTDSIRGIHRAIEALEPGSVKQLLFVSLLATIRRVSRATTEQGRLFLDAATAVEDARPIFERTATKAIRAVSSLPKGRAVPTSLHDARQPLPMRESASLCILHPPYFNAYKYSRVNSLELAWSGTTPASVRRGEVGEYFKVGKPENATHYVTDMAQVVSNSARAIEPGGVLVIMIGDTRLQNSHIPVTRSLLDQTREAGLLQLERIILRIPRHTEATWVASQRRSKQTLGANLCDYLIVLRRTP